MDRTGSPHGRGGSTPATPPVSHQPAFSSGQDTKPSLDAVLQHLFVEREVHHDLLKPGILVLQLAQSPHLRQHHARVLFLPIEIRRLTDPSLAADLRHWRSVFHRPNDERLLRVSGLDALFSLRRRPGTIVSDNGTGLTNRAVLGWQNDTGIKLYTIALGNPAQNARIEAFSARFSDELLSEDVLTSYRKTQYRATR